MSVALRLILVGGILNAAFLFFRNIYFATSLEPAGYATASTFLIVVAFIELFSALGLSQFLIQDQEGGSQKLQATVHFVSLAKAATSAVVFMLTSGYIAQFMGFPESLQSYLLLALIPIISGASHYDIYKQNRDLSFKALFVYRSLPPALSFLSAFPALSLIGDFRAALVPIYVNAISAALISHYFARVDYAVSLDIEIVKRIAKFGWPILVSGLLIFVVFHGERAVVANQLNPYDLALFSLATTLAFSPAVLFETVVSQFGLPLLKRIDSENSRDDAISMLSAGLSAATLFTLGVYAFVLQPLSVALFDDTYVELSRITGLLYVVASLRLMRSVANVYSLSQAKSQLGLIWNAPRAIAVIAGWLALEFGGNIDTMIAYALVSEALSWGVANFWLSSKRSRGGAIESTQVFFVAFLHLMAASFFNAFGELTFLQISAFSATYVAASLLLTVRLLRLYRRVGTQI